MNQPSRDSFKTTLATYKQRIDADIASYAEIARESTQQNYTAYSEIATDAYLSILERGGKRIRGALTMVGYQMMGGTDQQMILEAARAVEMMHAYILIIDDIQDRSVTRRGGPTAHVMLADYHKKHNLAGDAEHFGMAVALNAAIFGSHAAGMLLVNLPVEERFAIMASSIMNRTMVVTAHGQTNDIFNEVLTHVDEQQVDNVMEWKTAYYSFLNPLHVGMVLAGADCADTDAIREYAIHAGKAFQITDDILGTFGDESESGKSPMDDIREGKRTLLTVKALESTPEADKNYLLKMLGNQQLTPAEFARCKAIITDCGARTYAEAQVTLHITAALETLQTVKRPWGQDQLQFLRDLVSYLQTRTN